MDKNILKMIDHTLLDPDVTEKDIVKLCEEAKKYEFASVCVNPFWVKTSAEMLRKTSVKVCTVIGFPLGATTTKVKVFEAKNAIKNGATEVDMVLNIGSLKEKNYELVKSDIASVHKVTKRKALLKVIIEVGLLTEEEKTKASEIVRDVGVEFIKTSTGVLSDGPKVSDVLMMKEIVGEGIGVKASGGIRDLEKAKEMIDAGATRIGTSSGVKIANGEEGNEGY